MPTVLEPAPKARFPCLTTHFGPITPLVCGAWAFRCGQNCDGTSRPSEGQNWRDPLWQGWNRSVQCCFSALYFVRARRYPSRAASPAGSSRGPWPGLCRALCTGSEYAELVALGIAQHLPAPSGIDVVSPGGAECQGLRDRRGEITAAHVQM